MDLQRIEKGFAEQKILVIGDVMLDSYVYGQVNRISPEAPVPIVHVKNREERLGGAANVALNVAALGAAPMICSVVGSDLEGRTLERLFLQSGISTAGIVRSPKRPTTVKHRILAASQHLLRIDSEIDTPISDEETEKLSALVKKMLPEIHAVIFEDYDKGVLHTQLISWTLAEARKYGVPTVVDPKKRNFWSYSGANLFKPNLKELREGLNQTIEPDLPDSLSAAAQALNQRMPVDCLMVTLSEKGIFITDFSQSHHLAAHKREIADVSGAGDTVVSIAALSLAINLPIREIAALANLGGGLVCEHLGVVPISREKLFAEARRLAW